LVDPVPSHQTMPSIPAARYYPGQWLQIIQGAGVGQWRKIISVAAGSNAASATIAFNVVPALDVLPTMSQPNNSVVTVGTAFWQNLTVDNVSDQSLSRGCTKLNQDYVNPSGSFLFPQLNMGAMVWWGSAADSAMEGNELKDSGGIGLYHYFAPAVSGQTKSYTILKSSDTVRSNVISGQYDFTSPFSGGGISIPSGATAAPGYANAWNPTDPPVTAFGITIAGNSISQAASSNFTLAPRTAMGAIAVGPGLDASGPADANGQRAWKMANATLIFHNTLSNMSGGRLNRVGVGIASARTDLFETWRSVLYANNCSMQTPISDYGISTVRYCPTQASGSCECAAVSAIDIGVSASSSSSQVAVGNAVSFTVTVTNHDPSATATGVALSLESSAGIQIASMTVTSGTGVCNLSVNVCQLGTATFGTPGSLAPSTSQQVTVTGTAVGAGTWPTSFSVTHQDADPVVSNNGVTLSTLVQ
jgi:hypothetical protein